jgi:glutathione synthase/RimK-type ligase-like ATP-grasp enzyme
MDSLEDYECYDHLLFEPMENLGWKVEQVSWRNQQVDWNDYDVVVIRSPWDYHKDPENFFDTLQTIENSSALLENNLSLVEWNSNKRYMFDLKNSGVDIVPTLLKEGFHDRDWNSYFEYFSTDEIIIKPTVGASAVDTFRIKRNDGKNDQSKLKSLFTDRAFLVQPFIPSVITEGEFSLFYFGDIYSHTILKTPKTNDFRVQEEHGGRLLLVEPEQKLRTVGDQILNLIEPDPLYTRIDLVRTANDQFQLMELELIEPSLYFNMDPESPDRFAAVFDRWTQKKLE